MILGLVEVLVPFFFEILIESASQCGRVDLHSAFFSLERLIQQVERHVSEQSIVRHFFLFFYCRLGENATQRDSLQPGFETIINAFRFYGLKTSQEQNEYR